MARIKSFIILTCFEISYLTSATVIKPIDERVLTAFTIAFGTANDFYSMFQQCMQTFMPNEQFVMDNLFGYVNFPMKTTVGSNPDFTSNRKFFANLISTPAFKEMLAKDTREIRLSYYLKMKYCDEAVLDQKILRDFYDHEVDQTKLRK